MLAASIADPIVEFASNAGLFGMGRYTDHSNLDVVPALIAGLGLLALYFVRRASAILSGQALSAGVMTSLPAIFVLQLAVLYVMETAEQVLIWGHPLGSTIWLGAPFPIAVSIHAIVAFAVATTLVRSRRALAATTLRVIRSIRAIATLAAAPPRVVTCKPRRSVLRKLVPALRAIGERAPPVRCVSFSHRHLGELVCYLSGGFLLPS